MTVFHFVSASNFPAIDTSPTCHAASPDTLDSNTSDAQTPNSTRDDDAYVTSSPAERTTIFPDSGAELFDACALVAPVAV